MVIVVPADEPDLNVRLQAVAQKGADRMKIGEGVSGPFMLNKDVQNVPPPVVFEASLPDQDKDGVPDQVDNCPKVKNGCQIPPVGNVCAACPP